MSPPEGGWPHELDVPGCLSGMARVPTAAGEVCIHRFEVHMQGDAGPRDQGATWPASAPAHVELSAAAGLEPTKGVSWYQAVAACRAEGWHLCTSAEWEDACDGQPGPGGAAHPTLDGSLDGQPCNIDHPGPDGRLSASGRYPGCSTPTGIYDLEGNLWEWLDPGQQDAQGMPLIDKRGGGYYSGAPAPCTQAAVGSHPPSFDGTIGFRCCVAPHDN